MSTSISANSFYDNLSCQQFTSTYNNDQTDSQENTQNKRMKFQETINQSTYPQNTNIINNNNNNLNLSAYRSDNHNNSSNDEDTDLICSLSFNSNSNSNSIPTYNNKKVNNSFYGLPQICKDLLKELRNIGCLYDWQDELLTMVNQKYEAALQKTPFVLDNLLYLSPTR
jgi:hypothetical protein